MKKLLLLPIVLAISFLSSFGQCVELGTTVSQAASVLKSTIGFCPTTAQTSTVCDCPSGFIAVGYQGFEGNTYGGTVLSSFSLRCKQLNANGTLGAAVTVTCSNGTVSANTANGPVDATGNEALVGADVRIGCAIDAIGGRSKSTLDIAAGLANATSTTMTSIGGTGGTSQIGFVPDGNVIVGMQTFIDPGNTPAGVTGLSAGVAWRYAPISLCCDITAISTTNISTCNDNGTPSNPADDTFTADVTVTFANPPATGDLDLTGSVTTSIPVGMLGATTHTFTGTTLPADGSTLNFTATFSADPTCTFTNASAGTAPASCSSSSAYYLRGSFGAPCDWGNTDPACQLTDPDNDGIFTLTRTVTGRQEFKIYESTSDTWYGTSNGSNLWVEGGAMDVLFSFNSLTNEVYVNDIANYSICAPGDWTVPNWDNATPMAKTPGADQWCINVPNPGTYQWKPTKCGTWDSWQPFDGHRDANSSNWSFTTTVPNELICVDYDPATGWVADGVGAPDAYFLRGNHPGACGWNNTSSSCQLTDPDGDGIFQITFDPGLFGANVGDKYEFKIYYALTNTWLPDGANSWYNYQGVPVVFSYNSFTGLITSVDQYSPEVCAPGEFSGWDNSFSTVGDGNGNFCFTIENAGTYEWKPTVCGIWDSWQPTTGERSLNADNWSVTTTSANQNVCVSYDISTGLMSACDDGQAPTIACPGNIFVDLGSGECDAFVTWTEPVVTDGCPLVGSQTGGFSNGSTFPIGTTNVSYEVTDATGTDNCSFTVTVNEFPDPIVGLVCNDHVQVSLINDGCTLIGADHLLEGGGYACYENYDLTRNPALSVDNCGNATPQGFVWLNCYDQGRQITVTVTDPATGNSCWSKVTVEDKLGPVITCSIDLTDKAGNVTQSGNVLNIDCSIDPATIPAPEATDNCTHIPDVYLKTETITGEACNVLTLTRVYGSTDENGHDEEAPCTIMINITQPAVTFPEDVTWSCQQYNAFNNVVDASEMHALIIANAADIDRAFLCLDPNLGGDDVAGVDPYGAGNYWLDGEDLDISLDPRYDDDIDNPITDNNGACGNTTAESDTRECDANFSYMIINEGWDVDYLRDCDLNPGGHVPNIIRTPNHVRNAPLLSYPLDHEIRGIEDKDVLEVTGSGVPNVALTPNCTFAVTHKDQRVEACSGLGVDGSTFKIIRTWTVLNWCNGQTTTDVQVIKVLDRKAPVIAFGDDYNRDLVSNQPSSNLDHPDCRSNGLIDVPTFEDDCAGITTIRVYTPVGEATPVSNGGVVVGYEVPSPYLEMGTHTITFEATDACGNTSTATTNVQVVDGIPPVAVCRELTQIALSAEVDGVTAISAGHFDEGSYDYCGGVYFKARRMDRPDCSGFAIDRTRFNDEIRFCCSDIGTTVNVILRVYDVEPDAGSVTTGHRAVRSNDCMIEVLVEDKSRPRCTAPADVWTNCNDIRDNVDYENTADLNDLFGEATAADNCSATIEELAPDVDVDNCGVGIITRTFRATDTYGNRHLGTCEQVVMIMQQTEYTITVPGDFQEECDDASPQDLEYTEVACDLLAVSSEDKRFYANTDGECMKIIRTWKVINWCEYDGASPISVIPRLDINNDGYPGDGNGGSTTPVNHNGSGEWISTGGNLIFTANPLIQIRGGGYYSYEQHIKIYDNTAPALDYTGDTEFCGGDRDEDPCTGEVDIIPSIDELCTGVTVEWSLTAFSATFGSADFSGTDNLTGRYPLGTHTARFFVSDECGNTSEIDITFEIIDCKAPTPVCYNGLSIDVMPLSGMVEIWASDYDASSFDYCHPYELRINRVTDTNGDGFVTADDYQTTVPQYDSVQFTCADAGTFVTVQMWVGEISGDNVNNWDYCVSYMDVQDNNGVCNGSKVALGGKIANEAGESVENVMVELNNSMGAMTTDATGEFSFAVPTGGDYSITPMRTDDAANGVSTFDLIKISRHILNVELLNSAYKIIAADANNSGNISTVDLISIRKVILRVADEFPNNTSWRFVDKSYAFQNAAQPLGENFREVVNFNNLAANELTADFVAIKVGDVNGDATPNSVLGVDGRTFNGSLNFNSTDESVKAGETFEVAFTADKDVKGFQFTMDLNSTELVEIKNGMTADNNFNVIGNQVATSFNTEAATAGQTMFTLVLKATADVQTSNAVSISGAIATAEAYDVAGNMLNVGLDFGTTATNDFALFQNTPNPFKGETVIGFNLPESAAATLTVSDVSGKVLQVVTGDYTKGYNQVSLNSANLSQGVLYYQLDTDNFTATKKMVVIE